VQNSYRVSLLHFTGLLSPRKAWEECKKNLRRIWAESSTIQAYFEHNSSTLQAQFENSFDTFTQECRTATESAYCTLLGCWVQEKLEKNVRKTWEEYEQNRAQSKHISSTIQAHFKHTSSTIREQFWLVNSGVQNSYRVSLLHFTGLLSPRKAWEKGKKNLRRIRAKSKQISSTIQAYFEHNSSTIRE
jgi:hypothetical protein